MIVALDVPGPIGDALAREAALTGLTPAQWIVDRLSDRFGLPHKNDASHPHTHDTKPDDLA